MNYERLYEYRFRDAPQDARMAVWREISTFLFELLGRPERVLDPAAGRGEFINALPARERWAVDRVDYEAGTFDTGVRFECGDALEVDLPSGHFDLVWV